MEPDSVRSSRIGDIAASFADIATVVAATPNTESKKWFFAGYNRLSRSSKRARSRIFQDPRTWIWIDSVESVILDNKELPSDEIIAAWASQVGICALSAAFLDRNSYETRYSLLSDGRIYLPGAKRFFRYAQLLCPSLLSMDVNGILRVNGSPIEVVAVPESRGGLQLVTSDHLLAPPDVPGVVPLTEEEVAVSSWLNVLEEANRLIALHADSQRLARFGQVLVPVRGVNENTHCSVSFSKRPCVLYMSWAPSAEVIAEAIVHEADHQYFYVLTRRYSFWTDPVGDQPCAFRSPWRDDPRPLDGLLRGASAFVRVAGFWAAVLAKMVPSEGRDWTGRRIVLAARQSLDALSVICRFGSLSPAGDDLVMDLRRRSHRVLRDLSQETEFQSWQSYASEEEARHNEEWRMRYRATDKCGVTAQ